MRLATSNSYVVMRLEEEYTCRKLGRANGLWAPRFCHLMPWLAKQFSELGMSFRCLRM